MKSAKIYHKTDCNKTIIEEIGSTDADNNNNVVAQVFCNENDDINDANAVGRWIVNTKIWKKKSGNNFKNRISKDDHKNNNNQVNYNNNNNNILPRNNGNNNIKEIKKTGKKRKRSLYTQSVRTKQATVLITVYDEDGHNRKLFRSILHRSRADFSSDKNSRNKFVKGCLVSGENYELSII